MKDEKKNAQPPDPAVQFVERLQELGPGPLAILKRCVGRPIAQAPAAALTEFYRIVPPMIASGPNEEIYFLAATLYGHNKRDHDGDFGQTMRKIAEKSGSDNIARRMAILLDSEFETIDGLRPGGGELAYRLRQCVRLAASEEVGVNWPQLIVDLTWWSHPDKRARKRWATAFFGQSEATKEETQQPEAGKTN